MFVHSPYEYGKGERVRLSRRSRSTPEAACPFTPDISDLDNSHDDKRKRYFNFLIFYSFPVRRPSARLMSGGHLRFDRFKEHQGNLLPAFRCGSVPLRFSIDGDGRPANPDHLRMANIEPPTTRHEHTKGSEWLGRHEIENHPRSEHLELRTVQQTSETSSGHGIARRSMVLKFRGSLPCPSRARTAPSGQDTEILDT